MIIDYHDRQWFFSLDHFRQMHPGAEISEIDGKDCWGCCEVCRDPILVGDMCAVDCEGVILCSKCGDPADLEEVI